MSVVSAMMVPHPPIILPNIGKGEEKKIENIDQAYRKAARQIVDSKPDTVVLISPHIPAYSDYIQIVPGKKVSGNMGQFRDYEDRFEIKLDSQLVSKIDEILQQEGLRAGTLGGELRQLDHGTMVPLYYLSDLDPETKFVLVGVGGLSNLDHAKVGQAIEEAAEKLGRNIAVVASGDLSHCQKVDSSYGLKECGPRYDAEIMDIMENQDFVSLITMPESKASEAMVCGHQPFCVMAGILDGKSARSSKPEHSAVFGVGYGVIGYDDIKEDSSRNLVEKSEKVLKDKIEEKKAKEDPFVKLARKAIEASFAGEDILLDYEKLPSEMQEQAGTFVSLHKHGDLRGCIGTTAPTKDTIAEEIFSNAIQAAFHDPRFHPLQDFEVDDLDISVDVLGKPEVIDSKDQLDVKKYGVIVSKGRRRGLLLPDLEGVDTVDDQILIAKRKAGIDPDDEVTLQRFEVIRHH